MCGTSSWSSYPHIGDFVSGNAKYIKCLGHVASEDLSPTSRSQGHSEGVPVLKDPGTQGLGRYLRMITFCLLFRSSILPEYTCSFILFHVFEDESPLGVPAAPRLVEASLLDTPKEKRRQRKSLRGCELLPCPEPSYLKALG